MWNENGLSDALLDIVEIIKTIVPLDSNGKPTFKRIDIWNQQLKYEKDNNSGYTFPTPAVFVEMKPTNSMLIGMGVNLIDYDIILHIVDTLYNSGSHLDRNIKVFALRNAAKVRFQLYQPKMMGRLFFIKDQQDFTHNNVYHYVITFRGALLDTWGNSFPTLGTASAVLSVGYTQSIS